MHIEEEETERAGEDAGMIRDPRDQRGCASLGFTTNSIFFAG
jgi:hypothetical protein